MPIATKPPFRKYVAPPTTKADIEYCNLRTIKLSQVDSPIPEEREAVYQEFKRAVREDGFFFLEDFGLTQEQIDMQFAIAQHVLIDNNITPEEKERLQWKYLDTGKYTGYKPRGYWDISKGVKDNVESFNWYSSSFVDGDHLPSAMRPYLQDLKEFNEHLHDHVNYRLLAMLSRMLELPETWLWENVQSHNGTIGEGYFRQMMFHPSTEERSKAAGGVQMHGHQDYGNTTLLLSQPIAALQVLGRDNKWRWVPYKHGGMVVNLGEVLEFISGGHLPATRHRVSSCPPDQAHEHRLTIGLFCAAKNEVSLAPLTQSPLLQREGYVDRFEAGEESVGASQIPTAEEWRVARVLRSQTMPEDIVYKDGVKYNRQYFKGIYVLEPV